MKYIWLGIKDYCKDVWHDFWFKFWNGLWDFARKRTFRTFCWSRNEALLVKEGSVWHYIRQRRIAKKDEKRRRIKWKKMW